MRFLRWFRLALLWALLLPWVAACNDNSPPQPAAGPPAAPPSSGGSAQPGPGPAQPVQPPPLEARVVEPFQRYLRAVARFAFLPTLSVALVDAQGVRWSGTWINDQIPRDDAGKPATFADWTPESRYAVESLTKSMTALALLCELDAAQPPGSLTPDMPCTPWLPTRLPMSGVPPEEPILFVPGVEPTFREVLCHATTMSTTGKATIPDINLDLEVGPPGCDYGQAINYRERLALFDLGRRPATQTPRCGYLNENYFLAGWLLVQLAHPDLKGKDLPADGPTVYGEIDRLLHERLFTPLGMARTGTMLDRSLRESQLPGAGWNGSRWDAKDRLCHTNLAAQGALSTAEDLGRLLAALLGRGKLEGQQVLPEAVIDQAQKTPFPGPTPGFDAVRCDYAAGWFRYTVPGQVDLLWHPGWHQDVGVFTLLLLDLKSRSGVCLLTNTAFSNDLLAPTSALAGHGSVQHGESKASVLQPLLLNLAGLGVAAVTGGLPDPAISALTPEQRERVQGYFVTPDGAAVAAVYEEDDALLLAIDRTAALLVPDAQKPGEVFACQRALAETAETVRLERGAARDDDALHIAQGGGASTRWPREREAVVPEPLAANLEGVWLGQFQVPEPADPGGRGRAPAPDAPGAPAAGRRGPLEVVFGSSPSGPEIRVSLPEADQPLNGQRATVVAVGARDASITLRLERHGAYGNVRLACRVLSPTPPGQQPQMLVEWIQGVDRRRALLQRRPRDLIVPVRVLTSLRGVLRLGGRTIPVEIEPASATRANDQIRFGGPSGTYVDLRDLTSQRDCFSFRLKPPVLGLSEFDGAFRGGRLVGTARGRESGRTIQGVLDLR